ncbi:MAG: type IV pilin protein [Gallionella sp.]|nr:type IV pilin protein [Gallionella sp.]
MKTQQGFSLIELLIVVGIVAILASVAMPMYSAYLVRGKVVEAQSTLTSARVRMEQYYQDHRTYVGGDAAVNATTPGACPLSTTYFNYACAVTASTFTITATSRADNKQGLGAAGDYTYSINQVPDKKTTKFAGVTSSAICWISKKGESC